MYWPIFLVRIDERTDEVFILAGGGTEILIDRDGEWRSFIEDIVEQLSKTSERSS
jgi:UDP-2,3-diacylglucosamine pyrophosphatase LpxH